MILSTLRELDQHGVVQLGGIEVGSQAPLFGELGRLDSVSSVSLSVAVAQALEGKLNLTVSLTDGRSVPAHQLVPHGRDARLVRRQPGTA